ncbi:MAG: hypothetical protein DRH93_17265, partial [Deltaproteobacteria bacterium]
NKTIAIRRNIQLDISLPLFIFPIPPVLSFIYIISDLFVLIQNFVPKNYMQFLFLLSMRKGLYFLRSPVCNCYKQKIFFGGRMQVKNITDMW